MAGAGVPGEAFRAGDPGEALRAAARRYGTPLYLTSVAALGAAAAELREAFPDPWLRAFSLKANDQPAIVARLGDLGLGANVVSAGEWAAARRAGIPNARTTLEGIGKVDADLRAAVGAAVRRDPLRWVALESADELAVLSAMAGQAGLGRDGVPAMDVLLRLNPEVAPETHAGLAVGRATSKFGMSETELTAALSGIPGDGPLCARGIHLHVGSQLGAVDAWRDAVRRGLALLALLGSGRAGFDTFDVGGGFPVGEPGTVPAPARFARELPALLDAIPPDRRPARLAVEPGRFLVARAGWLAARVLHVRERSAVGQDDVERVIVIDAGMTELIRPALYGARHHVVALTSLGRPLPSATSLATSAAANGPGVASTPVAATGPGVASTPVAAASSVPTRVDGPVCESTDTFGYHDLPALRRGDLVAIADAGAYAASMAMTYNGRPSAPQVLLEPDGTLTLARRRGRA